MADQDVIRPPTSCQWLQQRQRHGNWFDIAETDQIPSEIDSSLITILHMFQLAFAPEIRQRLSAGTLDDAFFLTAAQVIQMEDRGRIVRLNDEVRGTALVRANRPIKKGEQVFASDMKNFVSFDLLEDELDAGHFTLFWTGQSWVATFDFRMGRSKSTAMLEAANEFIEVARLASTNGYPRPSVDNLFSACELVSKVHLILQHSIAGKAKTHGRIKSAINERRNLGNVNDDFVDLFNRVSNTRSPARYDARAEVEMPTSFDLQIVHDEIEKLMGLVALRTDSNQ